MPYRSRSIFSTHRVWKNLCWSLLLTALLTATQLPALDACWGASPSSPVDRSKPLELIRDGFGLVDGAAADGALLYVPDVKAKQLLAYRTTATDSPWQLVATDVGGFSGTFFQLTTLYAADNQGARILRSFNGKEFDEWVQFGDGARPNDLVVDAFGNAYVTFTKEGEIRRIAADGSVAVIASSITTPNGITLAPDASTLYVSSTKPGVVLRGRVDGDNSIELTPFATLEPTDAGALADGMSMDRAGNVYCAGADSVWIWSPDGELLDRLHTPERPINCAFGGPHGLDLYISTFGGLMRQPMQAYGVAPNPAMDGPASEPKTRPSTRIPDSIRAEINQVYYQEGNRRLLCDLFVPNRDEAGQPAIVLVHGGGWLHGDKTKFRPLAIKLSSRGYVVMAIEYRLGFEAHFPAGIHDCNAAVRYLRTNASRYNLDPDRISAVGGSAGGHLVGLMATGWDEPGLQASGTITSHDRAVIANSAQLKSAVVMAGPMQIASGSVAEGSTAGKTSNATHWLGNTIDDAPALYHLCDAYEKITADDPPMLFITGSEDNPTRDEPSLRRLKRVGVPARQIMHEGATHGHWNRPDWIDQVVSDIDDFLKYP